MSTLPLLSLQTVLASLQPDEDFAPPAILFFQADGVTPIDLSGLSLTARIGNFPPLTSANGMIAVSGNALSFFVAAAAKNWPTGRYPFALTVSDGVLTRDIFAHSWLTVGQPASFSVASLAASGVAVALANLSGASLLALMSTLSTAQLQSFGELMADAQAAAIPRLDFSHVANSQFIGSTPFLFTM